MTVDVELSEYEANILAADIYYLIEHTKNLPATVRAQEAPFTMESRERLMAFVAALQAEMMGKKR